MSLSTEAYILSKKYTDETVVGGGAIKGKNCTIESTEKLESATRVTFKWTLDDGTVKTGYIDIPDGVKGEKGDRGAIGPTGATGSQGVQGPAGPKGDPGEKGAKGDTGNTGATGADGTAATIQIGTVISGASPSVSNVGTSQDAVFNFVLPKGDKGDQGIPGNDGADGKSFDIKSQYPTYAALIAAHPTGETGDAYFVGTDENPDLYIWLTEDNKWYNNGKIAGVKGDKGDQGDEGFSPVASVTKNGTVTTITIRDKIGTTTATINDGVQGSDGKSAYEVAVDEGFIGTESEWLASLIGEQGPQGIQGEQGIQGIQGIQGDPGIGLPDGGETGQVLVKYSNEDYDFDWKGTTDRVRPNSHALVESGSVYSAINEALNTIYTPRGDLTCAELTASLLIDENVGSVYEMSDSGETSALFINGAGITINEKDNVGIIKAGPNTILFNYMGNAFDLTSYQKIDLSQAIEGATTVEGALGALSADKADKVSSATTGDIATLDANGNLVDSGKKTSDFVNNYNYSMTGTSDAEADIKALIDVLDNLSDNGTYAGQFIRRGHAAGTYTASMFKDSYHKYVEGVVTSASNDFTVVKDTLLSTGVSTYYIKELSVYKYLGGARGEGTSGGTTIGDIFQTWTFLIPSSKVDVNTNYFTYDSATGNFIAKKAGKYKVTFYMRYSDTTSSSLCSNNNNIALSIFRGKSGKYHEFGGSNWMVLDARSTVNSRLSQTTEWVIDCGVNETISVGGYTDNRVNDASCWAYHLDIEKIG